MFETFLELINHLREIVSRYRADLEKSEALTRYCLVDPFLRSWGWDLGDPSQVRPEFTTEVGRPDYALLTDGKPTIYVGVKALGKQEKIEQYINYCITTGVPYFITTDGVKWEVYDTHVPKPLPEKKIIEWDIINDKPYEIIRKAFTIWRLNKELMIPPEPIRTQPIEKKIKEGVPLNKIKPKLGEKFPYSKIVFPDGRSYQVDRWVNILYYTSLWLVETGKISDKDLPITAPRGWRRVIINRIPKHLNDSKFNAPKTVGSYFVETNINSKRAISQSVFLLKKFNIDPSKVLLQ